MTPTELRSIRLALGLTQTGFGRALGYSGKADTGRRTVARYEGGELPVPEHIARLAIMYGRHGVPDEFSASKPATKAATAARR